MSLMLLRILRQSGKHTFFPPLPSVAVVVLNNHAFILQSRLADMVSTADKKQAASRTS
jgi:hypothetical protein